MTFERITLARNKKTRKVGGAPLRVVKTVVLENSGFCPFPKQGILTKTAQMTSLHSTHKNKGLGPQKPENDEDGGRHSDKTMVYRKRGFCNPDPKDSPRFSQQCVKIPQDDAQTRFLYIGQTSEGTSVLTWLKKTRELHQR